MPTVDELRAKAAHYRAKKRDFQDPKVLEAIEEIASELDREADEMEPKARHGDDA